MYEMVIKMFVYVNFDIFVKTERKSSYIHERFTYLSDLLLTYVLTYLFIYVPRKYLGLEF